MADDYIQQIAEEHPDVLLETNEALRQGLSDAGISDEDIENNTQLINDMGNIICSTASELLGVAETKGLPTSLSLKVGINNTFVPVSIYLDYQDGESILQSIASNIVPAVVSTLATIVVGATVVGGAATLGAGIVAGATTAAGVAFTVGVGYLTSFLIGDTVDAVWERYVGPKVMGSWDNVEQEYNFTTHGRLSDSLYAFWEGIPAAAGDGWNTNLNLSELDKWTISSFQAEQTLVIECDRLNNTFSFEDNGIQLNLFDVYYKYDIPTSVIKSFFYPDYWGVTEGSGIVEEILRHSDGDFKVLTEDGSLTYVHNFCQKKFNTIKEDALNGDKVTFWAIRELYSFVEIGEDDDFLDVFHPEDYSQKYLEDRAAFLYHYLNEGMKSQTTEDIDFEDLKLGKEAYAGNEGFLELPQNAKYIFGTEGSNDISGSAIADRADHLYGMDGNDTIKGYGGDDYIEGGIGQDTMYGGDGNDTFYIQGTDENYDTFNGGEGTDTIQGSTEDDTIKVHKYIGEDRVNAINGGGGEDIIAGTDMADFIDLSTTVLTGIKEVRGGGGVDTITGTVVDDIIYGEAGNDILSGGGGGGLDFLYGGTGKDIYIIGEGVTYITDEDNNGIIKDVNGQILNGNWEKSGDGLYTHTSTGIEATLAGSVFTVEIEDGTTVILNSFIDGMFGIHLGEEPIEVNDPSMDGIELHGDYALKDYVNDDGNIYHKKDELGNWILDKNNPDQGRDDELYDSTGNDAIYGHGGEDSLHAVKGGDDHLDGGSGDDWMEELAGEGVLVGGEGSDAAFGGDDGDTLYADEQLSREELELAYAEDEATGERGDLLSGQDGNDLLYGWNGNDALAGGAGDDTIYGGAGDDTIEGDNSIGWFSALYPWDVFREATTENNVTTYNRGYSGGGVTTTVTELQESGNDIIYAGAGEDWVYAGGGNDYIDAGDHDDVVFGEEGNDTILGGIGNDHLNGDSAATAAEDQGSDIIDGGQGNDNIWGGEKDDILTGGAGEDTIYGDYSLGESNGSDYIDGGDDADTIIGSGKGDFLYGGGGNDNLYGDYRGSTEEEIYHGDDLLDGGEGNDYIEGGGGDDTVIGGSGDDNIRGDASRTNLSGESHGNDIIWGDAGVDQIVGGGGDDIIDGGVDNDYVWGDEAGGDYDGTIHGKDIISGGDGNDQVLGGGDDDIISGGAGDDLLLGDARTEDLDGEYHGDDTVWADAGNDEVRGGGGSDIIDGGDGNDLLWGDEVGEGQDGSIHGQDTVSGGEGSDQIVGGGGNDILSGDAGNDAIWGDDVETNLEGSYHGNDTIYGGEGEDNLYGDGGDDVIYGDADDDTIHGGDGNDTLYGGAGNDMLLGGGGNDTLDGGEGDDVYYYSSGWGGLWISDAGGTDRLVFQGGLNLGMVSLSLGSLMISTGTQGDEIHLTGVDYGNLAATSPIDVIEFSDGETLTVAELIELKGIDIASTEEDDTLEGTSATDNINGLGGDDTVEAGGGNDIIDLGAGNDTLHAGEGDDTAEGNTGSDTMYGDGGNDILSGNAGDDFIYGGDGDDTLDGGDGVNALNGGQGNDQYFVHSTGDTVAEAADQGTDKVIADLDYTLTENVENLELAEGATAVSGTGNSLDNTLTGNNLDNSLNGLAGNDTLDGGAGNDTLDGGTGADTMSGGTGDDIYLVDDAGDSVVELSGEGRDRVVSDVDHILADNVEDLELSESGSGLSGTGNSGDNTITGNSLDNSLNGLEGADTLNGGIGSDTLDGGAGADTMTGSTGDDVYHVDEAGDIVVEAQGEGEDRVVAGIDYTLGDHVEHLDLAQGAATGTGNSLDNLITGNAMDNTLNGLAGNDTLAGGEGNDTLDGGTGTDLLQGGTGNDNYKVHSADDTVVELAGEGQDKVISDIDYTLGDHLEDLKLAQGAAAGTGNSLDNTITGNALDNSLYGLGGADTLNGGGGSDTLDGGAGADTMAGGTGDDLYLVENTGDIVAELDGAGNDHVRASVDYTLLGHVERLTLEDGALNGTGNGLANTITGNDGDNILDGQGGGDTLIGGSGNDTYRVVSQADTVIEESGQGTDTVEAEGDYTLSDHVENLILTGTTFSSGTGNDENNVITGNSGNNILNGNGGNDQLYGGAGSDRLTGGSGTDTLTGGTGDDTYVINSLEDTIVEQSGQGMDTVESSISYTLGAELENLTLTGSQDLLGTGNALDNSLAGNSGNNTLDGGAGADAMTGGEGDDTYHTDDLGDFIYENDAQGTDTEIRSHDSDYLLASNVENLILNGTVYRGNGNELDNTITGNDADNNLWGREGSDSLYGHGGADQMTGDTGSDYMDGGDGNDIMSGGDGNDTLLGGAGNDQLQGGSGADTLKGGAGDDTYVFGADGGVTVIDSSDGGDDWLIFTDDLTSDRLGFIKSGDDLIVRVDGDESRQATITNWFLGAAYQLYAVQPSGSNGITAETINRMFPPDDAEADTITVPADLAFDMKLYGTSSDEQLVGSAGNDLIRGYQGTDNIFAQGGDDWLLGGSGNDQLDGGIGNDMLCGGAGNDTYVFRAGYGEETIDNTGGGTDWLLFADGLTQNKLVFTQDGDDLVITIQESTDKVTVTNWFLGADYQIDYIQPDGGSGISAAQIASFLSSPGSDFDTVVDGTDVGEQLAGSSGKDQINGLGGADQLFGLGDNDELNGDDGADYLDGGDGDDIQNGGAGNDQLGGDAGDDTLVGGTGDDTYVYGSGAGADTIDNQDGGTDWLIFNDDITSDRLAFIQSEDDLVIRIDDDETTQVTVTGWFTDASYQLSYVQPSGENAMTAAQINALFSTGGPTTGDTLEVPDESTFDNVNTGTASAEQVIGSNDNDLLKGLEGNDQLFAFGGDDWLLGGDGDDYFDGGADNDTMLGGPGNDQLGGDAGNDLMAGGAGDDKYVYRPGSGADTIINTGGGTDWILFTDDITSDRLGYFQSGDDLLIKIDGSSDTMVTVKDWFLGGENEVAYIQPSGGYGIPATTINTMVEQEPEQTTMACTGTLSSAASALDMTGADADYASFSKNAGLYLGDTQDLGVSDGLTYLAETENNTNNTLLAAV